MDEDNFRDQVSTTLGTLRDLLNRSLVFQKDGNEIDKAIHDLEKKHTETSAGMLESANVTNKLAGQRTDMARERTALVRQQTKLSTRSTELATIRTQLARERTSLANQRTDLSVLRTEMARARNRLASERNKMASRRTELALGRTSMAETRTILSTQRTELAKGRTYLALIRTGLAFLTLSITLFRLFGISWWSLFDGALRTMSLFTIWIGLSGYMRCARAEKSLELMAAEQPYYPGKNGHLATGSMGLSLPG
jgi:uncharacterized membrane protein YidH (DUF202 family)